MNVNRDPNSDSIGVDFVSMMLFRWIMNTTFFVDPSLRREEGLNYIEQHVDDLMLQFSRSLVALADGEQPNLEELLIAHGSISEDANTFLADVRAGLVVSASLMFLYNRAIVTEDSEEREHCNQGVLDGVLARERLLGHFPLSLFMMVLYRMQIFFPDILLTMPLFSERTELCDLPKVVSDDPDLEDGNNFRDIIHLILHLDIRAGVDQMSHVSLPLSALGRLRGRVAVNPLVLAVLMQDSELISELIEDYGVELNAEILGAQPIALSEACSIPNLAIISELLSYRMNPNMPIEVTRGAPANTQVALSVVLNNYLETGNETYFEMVRVLLKYRADPNALLDLANRPTGWPAINQMNLFGYFILLTEQSYSMDDSLQETLVPRIEKILTLLVQNGANIYYSVEENKNLYLDHLRYLDFLLPRHMESLYRDYQRTHPGEAGPSASPGPSNPQ